MASTQQIGELVQVVTSAFKNHESSEAHIQYLNNFVSNLENINICYQIISNPDPFSDAVVVFASNSFCVSQKILFNHGHKNFSNNVFINSFRFLTELYEKFLGPRSVVLRDCANVIAIIFENYMNSPDIILQMMGEISSLLDPMQSVQHWNVGIIIYLEIISTISLSQSKDIRNNFAAGCLPVMFNNAFMIIQNTFNTPEIALLADAVKLFRKVISFTVRDDVKDDKTAIFLHNSIRELISNVQIIQIMTSIYEEKGITDALCCIHTYCIISRTSFLRDQIPNIYNCLVAVIKKILSESIGLDDPQNVFIVTSILSSISHRLELEIMYTINDLDEFLDIVLQFTHQLLQIEQITDENEMCPRKQVITFWCTIGNTLRNEPLNNPIKQKLNMNMNEVCFIYLNFLLLNIQNNSVGILHLNEQKLSPYVTSFRNFIITNQETCEIGQKLIELYNQKKSEFINSIQSSNPNAILQMQLSLYVQIFISIVGIKFDLSDNPIFRFQIELLFELFKIFMESQEWVIGSIQTDYMEMSIINFINTFKETIFGKPNLKPSDLKLIYQMLSPIKITSIEEANLYLFNRLDFSFKLNLPNVIEFAIIALRKIKIPDERIPNLFELQNIEMLNNLEFRKIRAKYFSTLIFICSKNDMAINLFFQYLQQRFSNITPKQLCLLSIDIYGIFYETKESDLYNKLIFYLFPERINAFVQLMDQICNNPFMTTSVLKMWKFIVLNYPFRKKISFPNSSPIGTIIFKATAAMLQTYLKYFKANPLTNTENIYQEKFRNLKYSCVILSNLLSSEYICFEAFAIYNDTVLIDTIREFCTSFQLFSWDLLFTYPKVAKPVLDLLKVICEQHFNSFLQAYGSYFPNILDAAIMGLKTNLKELAIDSLDIINGILMFVNNNKTNENIAALLNSTSDKLNETHLTIWQYAVNNNNKDKVNTSKVIKNFLELDIGFMVLIKNRIKSVTNPNYNNQFNELMSIIDNNLANSEQIIGKIVKSVQEFIASYAINRSF